MSPKTLTFGIVFCLAVCAGALAAAPITLHVATNGTESGDGSAAKPFANLESARDAVRKLPERGRVPVEVIIHGGTYYLSRPLVLTGEDSGSAAAPVTYAAAPNEKATLSGGVKLDLKWSDHKDGIMRAPLEAASAADISGDQLFVNGVMQRLARYPNYDPKAKHYGGTAADAISPERIKRWSHPVRGIVHGLHQHEWGGFHYVIEGVNPDGSAKLEGGFQNNRRLGLHKQHRFVENIFEELDAPGEWFWDREKGVLYFYPPAGTDLASARVEMAGIKSLVEIRGSKEGRAHDINIQGLAFTQTARTFMLTSEPLLRSDWTVYRGGAVFLEGAVDCAVANCDFDSVGGNAVFVNGFNRGVSISGNNISFAGGNGICFVGNASAVRSPSFEYGESVPLADMDRTPGPKSDDYPARCVARDNLIHGAGQVEKQVAGVEISMAEEITVSHNSIYDLPRSGINLSEGTWGGHVIEFNDIFDTVKETGDHGSFNSWGRDRYWHPNRGLMDKMAAENPEMPFWDARKTTIMRNNRWRCDHGWDIDLDDGSSNYHIYNNLCLNGGLKLREGFGRTVENNIMVNNSFHPHVWFQNSGDVFSHNIVTRGYFPIGMPKVWGKLVDQNLFPEDGSLPKAQAQGLDPHSLAGDPQFVDPANGDYRVKEGSPAFKIGFKNFPMDQFGVTSPRLRALARRPELPTVRQAATSAKVQTHVWCGMTVKDVTSEGEKSSAGLAEIAGVMVLEVPENSLGAVSGFRRGDVVLGFADQEVRRFADIPPLASQFTREVPVKIFRNQMPQTLKIKR